MYGQNLTIKSNLPELINKSNKWNTGMEQKENDKKKFVDEFSENRFSFHNCRTIRNAFALLAMRSSKIHICGYNKITTID